MVSSFTNKVIFSIWKLYKEIEMYLFLRGGERDVFKERKGFYFEKKGII